MFIAVLSLPSDATSSGPIPTATAQPQSSPVVIPTKKVAIAIFVILVAIAFFVYCHQRCHHHSPSSDSRKLVASPPSRGFPVEDDDDQHLGVPPQLPNFLYLGMVERSAGGNSNLVKGSLYGKLNSMKQMELGRYRLSLELTLVPPLVQPPPDSVIQMMSSSDDDEQVANRVTETAFHTPQGSFVNLLRWVSPMLEQGLGQPRSTSSIEKFKSFDLYGYLPREPASKIPRKSNPTHYIFEQTHPLMVLLSVERDGKIEEEGEEEDGEAKEKEEDNDEDVEERVSTVS